MSEVQASIEERVKRVTGEQLGIAPSEIENEWSFVCDMGADSLDSVELLMALEDEFALSVPDEGAEKIDTVQQAIDYATANVRT